METYSILLVVIAALFALLLGGAWVFCALGVAGILGIYLLGMDVGGAVAYQVWGAADSFILTAIPLFIFMGEVMLKSGMSASTYSGLTKWVGGLPGGLLHTNVVSCALFAAISGSSVATAATMGTVAIPDQRKRGYDKNLILGSLVASGTLGILIPPSIIMILYGAWMEASVARLFAGGILPGIILSVAFMGYILARCAFNPALASRVRSSWKERLLSLREIWPGVVLILFIMGAIFSGWMTPSETAAVSALATIVIIAVTKGISARLVFESALDALYTSSMILLIYICAKVLVMCLMYLGITAAIPQFVVSLGLPRWAILGVIFLLYLVLGCFFDGTSLLLVSLPLVQPLVIHLGLDIIWFGVIATVLIEIGLITPPVGLNLYVIMSAGKATLGEVVKSSLPFFLILLGSVLLFTFFPQIVTFLPTVLLG